MQYTKFKETILDGFRPINIDNTNNDGHGHTLSVKIVVPCYCQAHCPFCFNNQTINTQQHNWDGFITNIYNSLKILFNNIDNRHISLDITGNEPTFNIQQFKSLMDLLCIFKRDYGHKIDKIVLTTNGFHLYECIPYMRSVVDIVNISLHHYDYKTRQDIFKTKYIPSNNDLKIIIQNLNDIGISVTSVAVIYTNVNMIDFVNNFASFSKEIGFKDARIRVNFTTNNPFIRNLFYTKFENEEVCEQKGLATKYLMIDNYNVNIYLGVTDLIDYVVGVEMVIDDDGMLYVDYNKRYPVDVDYLNDFNKHIFVNE